MMAGEDVEAIERATVETVAPDAFVEAGGWLVALSAGPIGRAKSAAPLRHDLPAEPAVLDRIEALYAERGLGAAFRIADAGGLASVRTALAGRGYAPLVSTLTMTGEASAMRALARDPPCGILDRPDAAWGAVFQGEGFDPVEGAGRVEALARAPDAAYAFARVEGRVAAVGMAAFGHGWASVHGMRTEQARRGDGLAGRVLAALAEAALSRGIERVFLQVEEANAPAVRLYQRAGFRSAWRYEYWRRAG